MKIKRGGGNKKGERRNIIIIIIIFCFVRHVAKAIERRSVFYIAKGKLMLLY